MRLLLLLLLGLGLLSSSPSAQTDAWLAGRWEVSLTLSPEFGRATVRGNLREEVTDPTVVPAEQRRFTDTVEIGGATRFFARPPLNDGYRATDTGVSGALEIRAHRRFGSGFEATLGVVAARTSYSLDPGTGLTSDRGQLFDVSERWVTTLGAAARLLYYPLRRGRFRAYGGPGLALAVVHTEGENYRSVYVGPTGRDVIDRDIPPRFFDSYILDSHLTLTAGVLYVLSPDWSLGLEAATRQSAGQGWVGLQMRRTFGSG